MGQPYRNSQYRSNPEAIEERLPRIHSNSLKENSTIVNEPSSSTSSLMGYLERLKFGYEDEKSTQQQQQMMVRRRFANPNRIIKQNHHHHHIAAAIAVCDSSRVSGCAPLISQEGLNGYNSSASLTDLPCVTDGTCPFIKFRCSRGHEWKAAPGSPVCMHCPICNSKRISGRKRDSSLSRSKLRKELSMYVSSKGGQLISRPKEITSHNTHVKVKCQSSHE